MIGVSGISRAAREAGTMAAYYLGLHRAHSVKF
jgi:hypothetical protein